MYNKNLCAVCQTKRCDSIGQYSSIPSNSKYHRKTISRHASLHPPSCLCGTWQVVEHHLALSRGCSSAVPSLSLDCTDRVKMDAAIGNYREWANGIEDVILEWARDGQPVGPTKGWFLTDFATALAIVIGYLAFVTIGPIVMSQLNPIESYPVRFVYNVVQIILCSYMCVEAFMIAYRNDYPVLPCAPFDSKNPPAANLLWLFYVSKVLDFMDTLFIVLKKSWRQLSFLHVYHHCTIFLFYWLNINAGYDGDVFLTIVLNGFIHTVMYTYYFVSMHTKDIWWKKYLTLMQMVQFVCMATQAFYLLATGCQSYPSRIVVVYAAYILSLLFLFAQFYVSSYSKKPSGKGNAANGSKTYKKTK